MISGFDPLFVSSFGVRHYMRENADGTTTFAASQDTDPVIEHNKRLATHNDGYSPTRELRRVASIPFALILKWKQEEGWDAFDPACADKLAQKLNSNEYLYLRTAEGRVGATADGLR